MVTNAEKEPVMIETVAANWDSRGYSERDLVAKVDQTLARLATAISVEKWFGSADTLEKALQNLVWSASDPEKKISEDMIKYNEWGFIVGPSLWAPLDLKNPDPDVTWGLKFQFHADSNDSSKDSVVISLPYRMSPTNLSGLVIALRDVWNPSTISGRLPRVGELEPGPVPPAKAVSLL